MKRRSRHAIGWAAIAWIVIAFLIAASGSTPPRCRWPIDVYIERETDSHRCIGVDHGQEYANARHTWSIDPQSVSRVQLWFASIRPGVLLAPVRSGTRAYLNFDVSTYYDCDSGEFDPDPVEIEQWRTIALDELRASYPELEWLQDTRFDTAPISMADLRTPVISVTSMNVPGCLANAVVFASLIAAPWAFWPRRNPGSTPPQLPAPPSDPGPAFSQSPAS